MLSHFHSLSSNTQAFNNESPTLHSPDLKCSLGPEYNPNEKSVDHDMDEQPQEGGERTKTITTKGGRCTTQKVYAESSKNDLKEMMKK